MRLAIIGSHGGYLLRSNLLRQSNEERAWGMMYAQTLESDITFN